MAELIRYSERGCAPSDCVKVTIIEKEKVCIPGFTDMT